MYDQILDANVNRASEGLRVIEEYVRFVRSDSSLTSMVSSMRKSINSLFPQSASLLSSRQVSGDVRAKEKPVSRETLFDLLSANFKRVQEALRVLEEYSGKSACNGFRYDCYDLESKILLLAKKPVLLAGVYLISDDPAVLEKGLSWGCSMVQLRDKFATKQEIYNKAVAVSEVSKKHSVPFIVNDYVDIALLVDADGLHTGQDDISVRSLRELMGDEKILGRTTHSLDQGVLAERDGADYVSVGPIYRTPSKPDRDPIGYDYLKKARSSLSIPYVAIGGIDDRSISSVMDCCPPMVGVIRSFDCVPDWIERFYS